MINASEYKSFASKHIGPDRVEIAEMLKKIGVSSLEQLIKETIPNDILKVNSLKLPEAMSEAEYLRHIHALSLRNKLFRSYIGKGYYGTNTPSVILRNIFENPSWYTQYTPYQAEISQGRLEALLNFQTMVSDLTGLPIANSSLLDEGTAAGEAMAMLYGQACRKRKSNSPTKFFVDKGVFETTKEVVISRAEPLNIEVVSGDYREIKLDESYFGSLVQYPDAYGSIRDYRSFTDACHEKGIMTVFAADLLALTLITPPGEFGADVVVGNTQRFGVPMGAGGPHAAYFATTEQFKRQIPGRIIGVSQDAQGNMALRMALQVREQHIKREKATSNICTAQALLAIMASMYAVYHGAEGLKSIAEDIHSQASRLFDALKKMGYSLHSNQFFDTISFEVDDELLDIIIASSEAHEMNFGYTGNMVHISIDETVLESDLVEIVSVLGLAKSETATKIGTSSSLHIPKELVRESPYLEHQVFKHNRNETEMMRYIKKLEKRDLSLTHSMIPLGSCTMKLNAATQLIPLSNPLWSQIHPFAPEDQREGYLYMLKKLESYLSEITGFVACSLQPNSGAQGELAGLLTMRAYHEHQNQNRRRIVLIPQSAHGTNPASCVMVGVEVVVVITDEYGNVDVEDLRSKADKYADQLAGLMITYPSTHGVFEPEITEICDIIHRNGGLVYMDGANMNAQVGYTSPGLIGADVCHLNLHKTFAIPHGGGGPGMGPICVNEKLAPFLPGHIYENVGGEKAVRSVSSAPYGSASILLISYAYIRLLGKEGLKKATEIAICNANYIRASLEEEFKILYTGKTGRVAHELIVDLREYKKVNVSAEDIAKRLIDYGFHSPTLSFPVNGTIMIEPTESENKEELDRFCLALKQIKNEILEIERGEYEQDNNVLVNAPHTMLLATSDDWNFPYPRHKAVWPLPYLKQTHKFWPVVSRVDNAYGDRNLMCTCPPIESYMSE